MRYFAISLDRLLYRFLAMMACVIVGLFIGQEWIALFALPIFLSAILGISFQNEKAGSAVVVEMQKNSEISMSPDSSAKAA